MTFLTTIKITLFISAFLLCGCVVPTQEDGTPCTSDTVCIDTVNTQSDAGAEINFGSSPEQSDTIVSVNNEVKTQKAIIIPDIEPTKISEPVTEQRQNKSDTFSYIQQINNEDSDYAHKKRHYEFQTNKVKDINDTISSIGDKFKKIEEKLKRYKK